MTIRALVVEEIDEHRNSVAQVLDEHGCESTEADTYDEGLRMVQIERPHLVVVGDRRGKMTGHWRFFYSALETMHRNKSKHRPFFVCLTPWDTRLNITLAAEVGCDWFSKKPVELHNVLGWISMTKSRFDTVES